MEQNPKNQCAVCRRAHPTDIEELEQVTWTATEQWDELLMIANEWVSCDKFADDSTQDSEDEEVPFIIDDDNEDDGDDDEEE